MTTRQGGGLLLALIGVALIVGAVRGTWQRAWAALTSEPSASTAPGRAPKSDIPGFHNGAAPLPGQPGSLTPVE